MKFDSSSKVQEVVWRMRDSEQGRSSNRAIINRQFNGDPPFTDKEVEENQIHVNRNFLKGVQVLADARRQWNNAMLNQANYFTVRLEDGPTDKKTAWGQIITRAINKRMKKSRAMLEQVRATGGNTMLHGIGPVIWKDSKTPYPDAIPIDALLIPSETELDFENLSYFGVYREWTPAELAELTNGENVDPGWNMKLVKAMIKQKVQEVSKELSGYADMSEERIEELIKQDGGYYGSDAVPTIDVWDFYFREAEDGSGWYRRIILDWDSPAAGGGHSMPTRKNPLEDEFLYTSGKRKYAESLSQIIHCQFGDCSAVFPQKYHSVRSLGWMLWGVCDLMNRLDCRITEATFENLMWFFRTSSQNDLERVKKASFHNMGIIPSGIAFVTAQERFTPNPNLIEMTRSTMKSQIAETSTSYTADFQNSDASRELTATETMARVNSANAMISSMMVLAYLYEEFKYSEMARRFATSDHPDCVSFREECIKKGVPQEAMDYEGWTVKAAQAIGAGNKTVEYAAVNVLQGIRNNLPPASQRRIDNLTIAAATDQPELADSLAPLEDAQEPSRSVHDAELATERLLSSLPFSFRTEMIAEDYVKTWLRDLALKVQMAMQNQASVTMEDVGGMVNLGNHIGKALGMMATNPNQKQKVREYSDALGQVMNHIKGLAQRTSQRQGAAGSQVDPETVSKIHNDRIVAEAKAANLRESHAQKAGQRQVQFEREEARKDRQAMADIRRSSAVLASDLQNEAIQTVADAAAQQNNPNNEAQTEVPQ